MAERFEINKGREDPKFRRFLVITPTNGMRQNAFSGIGSLFRRSVRGAYYYNQLYSLGSNEGSIEKFASRARSY